MKDLKAFFSRITEQFFSSKGTGRAGSYKYPADLITPLKATWQEWRQRESDPPKLPNDSTLQYLLETAYHASFTFDEERKTRCTAVICEPADATSSLVFSKAREFSAHELMRLAQVATNERTMIGIRVPEGRPPEIWGLCSFAFMQLTVTISGPARIEVGRNETRIVSLRGGALIPEDYSGGAYGTIAEFLSEANKTIWEGIDWPGGAWSPEVVVYPGYFLDIINRITRSGHGGMVLVLPENEAPSARDHERLRIKYPCDDNSAWTILQTAIRSFDSPSVGDVVKKIHIDSAGRDFEYLLDRIARLAAIDGAVLITDRFRILGFGTEVTARIPVDQVAGKDGMIDAESFGTRHRAAFRFSAAYPTGLAVVCSQDGGFKCVRALNGKIGLYEQ